MNKTQVLICGAGPTGLVLALWLTKLGINVRIIDKSSHPGETSRALVVHARTLEFYQQLGIQNIAIKNGFEFKAANLWVNRRPIAKIMFTDTTAPVSPYQYLLIYPQDEHEKMLVCELSKLGVTVERNTELISFEKSEQRVIVQLKAFEKHEVCEAVYLAGCDGAHSAVRKHIGLKFEGATYDNIFYLADIEASGDVVNGEMHGVLDTADFLAVFPMKGKGKARLVGVVMKELKDNQQLCWDDVAESIQLKTPIDVTKVIWFSSYKVHHRVASKFKEGNVFLLGDAAHVHSPVGGQGMNTGIGDAINLAWKIGAVLKQQSPPAILETYESERIAFARKLVSTTDRAFQIINKRNRFAAFVRTKLAPFIASFAFKLERVRHLMFKTLSQIEINYRQSSLSVGGNGNLKAGDRLPWVRLSRETDTLDNFSALKTLRWQVHCYGAMSPRCKAFLESKKLEFFTYAWAQEMGSRDLVENAIYLIRPDGYIALITDQQDFSALEKYLNQWMKA